MCHATVALAAGLGEVGMQKVILCVAGAAGATDVDPVSIANPLPVHDATGGGGGGGTVAIDQVTPGANHVEITDGTNTATVRNLAANDALNVAIVDAAGNQVTSFGSGTVGIDQVTAGANHVEIVGMTVPATMTPYNLTLTVADTEYSQALPANCLKFWFQCRSDVSVRWQIVTGKVAGPTAPWLTLKPGQPVDSGDINSAAVMTLYFASATAGAVMEIVAWTA